MSASKSRYVLSRADLGRSGANRSGGNLGKMRSPKARSKEKQGDILKTDQPDPLEKQEARLKEREDRSE